MGAWGPAIFSDDLAQDIRGEYNTLLSVGKSNAEAEQLLMSYYSVILNCDDEEEDVFWFALALAEWNKGRLSELAKENALNALKRGRDLKRWVKNEKEYQQRKTVLQKLEKTLTSPQPPEKKVKKPMMRRCPWKEGSLLAYRISMNPQLVKSPVYKKYVLIRVIRVNKEPVSKILRTELYDETMMIGLYGWIGESIPDPRIVDHLHYIAMNKSDFSELRNADYSLLDHLSDEDRNIILRSVENALKFKGNYCAELDWMWGRKKGDFTYLENDPAYWDKVPPEIKQQSIRTLIGLYGFEVDLSNVFSSCMN